MLAGFCISSSLLYAGLGHAQKPVAVFTCLLVHGALQTSLWPSYVLAPLSEKRVRISDRRSPCRKAMPGAGFQPNRIPKNVKNMSISCDFADFYSKVFRDDLDVHPLVDINVKGRIILSTMMVPN